MYCDNQTRWILKLKTKRIAVTVKPDQDFVVWSRGGLRHRQGNMCTSSCRSSDVDSHTYLVYTNYTDTCISHFILTIYKNRPARMNQKYINQDANETEINKISTVFTDGVQQSSKGKLGGGEWLEGRGWRGIRGQIKKESCTRITVLIILVF